MNVYAETQIGKGGGWTPADVGAGDRGAGGAGGFQARGPRGAESRRGKDAVAGGPAGSEGRTGERRGGGERRRQVGEPGWPNGEAEVSGPGGGNRQTGLVQDDRRRKGSA